MQRVVSRKNLKEAPTATKPSAAPGYPESETVVGDPIRTRITFRSKPGALQPDQHESRNYFAGLFPLCFVQVWTAGKHPKQPNFRYFAYLPNDDTPYGFESEAKLHNFLFEQLLSIPTWKRLR